MFKVKNKGIKTMCLRNIFSLQFTVFNRRDQCFVISRKQLRPFTPSRYTNAEMKISLYIQIHIKIIRSKFRILDRKNSRVIHRKIFIFLKKQVNFYHILLFLHVCKQTLRNLYGYITREFQGLRMRNFQGIIFI